jgi:hypothetical protein
MAGVVRQVVVWRVEARYGMAGKVRRGVVSQGGPRRGRATHGKGGFGRPFSFTFPQGLGIVLRL